MNLQLIAAILIFVLTLGAIVLRPWGVREWAAALVGALAMLVLRIVSLPAAASTLRANLNVFGYFLGLMTISAVAESAGIFDGMAWLAARYSRRSARQLMLNVMLVGALITVFLTNDSTALILTPVVYALVLRLRLEPLPFMYACTFIADTASFTLPVSNPLNVLVLTAFPAGLGSYLVHLLPAALLVVGANIGMFLWLFRAHLSQEIDPALVERPKLDRYFRFAALSLLGIAVLYVVASTLLWPISLVALGGGAWLLVGGLLVRRITVPRLYHEVSWSIFGFLAGLLIVVQGIEAVGLTRQLGRALVQLSGGSVLGAAASSVVGTAITANLINNVPAALVVVSSIQHAHMARSLQDVLVYGTIVGGDLGPNITTAGSLATILWIVILRRRGLEVSPRGYLRLGIVVTPVLLLVATIALWAMS